MIPSVWEGLALDDEDDFVDKTDELLETVDNFEVLLTDEVFELETLVVDEATLLLLDEAREVKRYISSLLPAPQYS